jgi:hypothetical protein
MLATGPKVRGLKLGEDDGLLKAITIHSTTSFRGGVKPVVPCHKILWHVKRSLQYERDTCRQNSQTFLAKFLPALLLGVSASYYQKLWWVNQE